MIHPPQRSLLLRRSRAAFTLVETLVATVIMLIAMGTIFQVSSVCMGIVRGAHDAAVASSMVQDRMQALQNTGWSTLTDSDSYLDQTWTDSEDGTTEQVPGLLKNATEAGSDQIRRTATETVRISAYRPIPNTNPVPAPITATRSNDVVKLTSAASSLVDETMVRIDLRLTWTDARLKLPRSLGWSAIVTRQ